jgi:geranylgeranyl diphosphate synthase type I
MPPLPIDSQVIDSPTDRSLTGRALRGAGLGIALEPEPRRPTLAADPLVMSNTSAPSVVLIDAWGRRAGQAAKVDVHTSVTPLHLAFSCYAVAPDGRVLITRRSIEKRTWPGVWTNSCCGHPRPGETIREAVIRHLADELGLEASRMTLAIGDFAYRAVMDDGTVEHELCPVIIAEVQGAPDPDPAEVDATRWITWRELVSRAAETPSTLSPWSVEQIALLARNAGSPSSLLQRHDPADTLLDSTAARTPARLDDTPTLGTWRRRVDAHIAAFLKARRLDVPEASDAIALLADAIESLTAAGGKRLRPAFVMSGHLAAGGTSDDLSALHAAAAVELLHTFALIHDDVMDRADVRRGRPTAHTALQGHHRGAACEREWFGISAGVLAGDLVFVWADDMFDRIEDERAERSHRLRSRRLFTELRTEVIAGQLLDIQVGCSSRAGEHDAARIALLKSARYTATRPLQIGAALAGGDGVLMTALGQYGDSTGMAFQLRDDVLGLFGDSSCTGKGAADDLREGKRTLLVLRAMRLTTDAGRATLEQALGNHELDDVDIERCLDVVASSGALASVEWAIDVHLERAIASAATFDRAAGGALTALALQASRRDR